MSHISYPTDTMRTTAQQIRTNASTALNEHNTHWNRVQNCISPLPGFIQSALNTILNPHDKHLRESYQWQMDLADQLEQAANDMDGLDHNLTPSLW